MKHVLYISYTGMTEPLGRSQVLEYLLDLSSEYYVHLISFERTEDAHNRPTINELIAGKNIKWYPLQYSNKFGSLSTVAGIRKAIRLGKKIARDERIEIIHCRSMIPAMMGRAVQKKYGGKLIFDIRGFSTEEKVDRGRISRGGLVFRVLDYFEDRLYKTSDYVVTLTHKAKDILSKKYPRLAPITKVIPTCANKAIFRPLPKDDERTKFRASIGYEPHQLLLTHTGTVTSWYDFDAELSFFKSLLAINPNVRLMILNKKETTFIRKKLQEHGLTEEHVQVTSTTFDMMPKYLNAADYSLFFIRPLFSKQASAPTKFAENVGCLLPSITNEGVGDMERWLNNYKVGFLTSIQRVKDNAHAEAEHFMQFHAGYSVEPNEFTRLFTGHFDKDEAVADYAEIYEYLTK